MSRDRIPSWFRQGYYSAGEAGRAEERKRRESEEAKEILQECRAGNFTKFDDLRYFVEIPGSPTTEGLDEGLQFDSKGLELTLEQYLELKKQFKSS